MLLRAITRAVVFILAIFINLPLLISVRPKGKNTRLLRLGNSCYQLCRLANTATRIEMKICLGVFVNVLLVIGQATAQPVSTPDRQLDLVIEAKISALLKRMTLEEKVGQMSQGGRDGKQFTGSVEDEIRQGMIGSFYNLDEVVKRNAWQKIAVEESRLGIPLMFGFDVIHGQRTIFPVPLAESASWNLELMERTARIAAKEARALGIDWTFSPMVDIARDPRWGRIVEGAGEDTYLGSLIARAKVKGYQGSDLSAPDSIAASMKHFVAYGAAEAGREYNTTEVPLRMLRDVYLPPFKAGVDAGAATFMSGFNDLDGVPATANQYLLTDILRNEWGFDGLVVSDWGSVEQLVQHGIARDKTQAGVLAATAGIDMEMVSRTYIENLPRLIREGKFSAAILDTAVRRILRIKYRLGLFDRPYVDPELQKKIILAPEHRQVARQAARESMVLLKNQDHLLPLARTVKSIALIGPLADDRKVMLGPWSTGARAEDAVTLFAGLQHSVGAAATVTYARGCDTACNSTDGFAAAVTAASQADIVLVAIGESELYNGESHSRANLDPPGQQNDLLKAIQQTGKPVIVILFAGRPLTINWALENVPAILLAWHPGIEGGNAISDVLFGDYNPAGKVTVTFPRAVGQIPLYYNRKNTGRPELAKHIDLSMTPLLPFGYGLSYTTFKYHNLKLAQPQVIIPGTVRVMADVTNTGAVAGHEVVQLYVRDIAASVTRPIKELKGFARIYLQPGETKTVTFNLPTEELKFYDINMQHSVEPGDFTVWVGPNSAEGLEARFELL
jgi:beta-glucosidase